MFDLTADQSNRLVRLTYSGNVGPNQLKAGNERLKDLLKDMRPGFRLLTDLSALDSMDVACVPFIEAFMDLCNSAGVSKVVRVIPDPRKDIGLNILSLFHYRSHIPIITCETLTEANQLLTD